MFDPNDTLVIMVKNEIRNALETAENEYNALFTDDGRKVYASDIHRQTVDTLAARLDDTRVTIQAKLRGEIETAQKQVTAVEATNALQWLNSEQLQRATHMAEFIKADVSGRDGIDASKWRETVHNALESGDKGMLYALLRVAPSQSMPEVKAIRQELAPAGVKVNAQTAAERINAAEQLLKDSLKLGKLKDRIKGVKTAVAF